MTKQKLIVDDIEIAVYTKGEIKNGCIFFVHGNSLSSSSFSKQFELIDDIPLVSIDLPGHGESAKAINPAKTYSTGGYAHIVIEAAKQLQLKNIVLCGFSLGGHIVLEAYQHLNFCKGIFTVGAAFIGKPKPGLEDTFLPHPALNFAFSGELSDEQAEQLAHAFTLNEVLAEESKKDILNTDPEARTSLLESVQRGDFEDIAKIASSLKISLAVVYGSKEPLLNTNHPNNLSLPTLWENKVHLVHNAGHSPHYEEYKQFNELLKRFYMFAQSTK